MKKQTIIPAACGVGAAALIFWGIFYLFLPAVNIKSPGMWVTVAFSLLAGVFTAHIVYEIFFKVHKPTFNRKGNKKPDKEISIDCVWYIAYGTPFIILAAVMVIGFFGSSIFNARSYSKILTVTECDFTTDISESMNTDCIALMDTASARMLGDREIGSLSNVVSQFDVSYDYIQIDYLGKPVKVSALEYAGLFKWINNRKNGAPGYVTVDPVSMSASFVQTDGMRYIPSAFFSEDASRYIRMNNLTLMFGNLHFEVDETGKPYYVASVYDKTVSLFGGKTVCGCLILDPVTGEMEKYDVSEISNWVDDVFDGDLICTQYNWYGTLQNGFMNSIFGKKGCKQVTTYYSSDDSEDETPASDYGYVSKDGDIWIYTGVTSVNGDSSNIGFLLANERTGESHYYSIAGADEKSAMTAAEGEVQEKGYQASFPSLINIDGNPTYIMVLKDYGGLVKLYATVNVEQYNLVATAATQSECLEKYRKLLGINGTSTGEQEAATKTVTIADIKYIDIDGNTYIYLIDTENNIYRAKAADFEDMLLLSAGDTVSITANGKEISEINITE